MAADIFSRQLFGYWKSTEYLVSALYVWFPTVNNCNLSLLCFLCTHVTCQKHKTWREILYKMLFVSFYLNEYETLTTKLLLEHFFVCVKYIKECIVVAWVWKFMTHDLSNFIEWLTLKYKSILKFYEYKAVYFIKVS